MRFGFYKLLFIKHKNNCLNYRVLSEMSRNRKQVVNLVIFNSILSIQSQVLVVVESFGTQ